MMNLLAFEYIKSRRQFLNISSIENEAGIKRTSLLNAINRNQKTFGDSDKLAVFLDSHFKGWRLATQQDTNDYK